MNIFKKLAVGSALSVAYIASAAALTITSPYPIDSPATGVPVPTCTGVGTGTDAAFITASCPEMSGVLELYKQNEPVGPGQESGALAGSYTSVFNGDLSGGTITWVPGTDFVDCSTGACWLLIKDGNQTPGRYAYDLTDIWNGFDTITLVGFWPDQGSISHWALYGTRGVCTDGDCGPPDQSVPEPGTLALLGLGLLGLGASRRRVR